MTSIFAATVSIYSILARYIYSLGVDRVLPRQLGAVHPKHHSPHNASFAAGVLFLIALLPFVVTGSDPSLVYGQMGGTGGYGYLILFALVSLAVLAYFRRERGAHSVNLWVSAVAPAVSLVAMSILLILGIMNFSTLTGGSGIYAVILQAAVWGSGLVGVALGLFYRAKRPDIFVRIGRRDVPETPRSH